LETIDRLQRMFPHELRVTIEHNLSLGELEEADAFIPLRNALLVSLAAAKYPARNIYLGALRGEGSRDKSARFFRQMSDALSFQLSREIVVQAPYRSLTKRRLVSLFLQREKDVRAIIALKSTRSCYSPKTSLFCGECRACFRRWVAMSLNGIQEEYRVQPVLWGLANEPSIPDGLRMLLTYPIREWPGILESNLDAWRAMQWAKQNR
jgi:7-cyano-7-deazaguanine synthase in queuosine biosynthesis